MNQLQDSDDRLEAAKVDYDEFLVQLDRFLFSYIKRMWKGRDPNRADNYVVQLPSHKDNNIAGRPRVLVGRIVESLRSALDYAVFVLSERNGHRLNARHPKFVIVDDRDTFDHAAKVALKHLTQQERSFVERLQPYHGNVVLALIRDASNRTKHRRLLSMSHNTNLTLVLADAKDEHKYSGWWRVASDSGSAFFAKPSEFRRATMLNGYESSPGIGRRDPSN